MVKRLRRQRGSGAVRRLPSGRWQASVRELDDKYTSLGAFATRAEADKALAASLTDLHRGTWINPRDGRITFKAYADRWLEQRVTLRPRTRELYERLLRIHLLPTFGAIGLGVITPSMVRQWHATLTRAERPGQVTVAKCYRLLRVILATATADELIARNPCALKGAGVEHSPERPVASIADVDRLAELAPAHMKALVLMATYTALRFGELAALTRRNLDLDKATVTVVASASELNDGRRIVGEPKSAAGRRTVSIPAAILPSLVAHLDKFAEPGRDGVLFIGPKGGPMRRGNFSVTWRALVRRADLEGLRFHDLRHTGNTLAAMTGASTKELMVRMGHSSTRAALGYQHATNERERLIATKLSEMITTARSSA